MMAQYCRHQGSSGSLNPMIIFNIIVGYYVTPLQGKSSFQRNHDRLPGCTPAVTQFKIWPA